MALYVHLSKLRALHPLSDHAMMIESLWTGQATMLSVKLGVGVVVSSL